MKREEVDNTTIRVTFRETFSPKFLALLDTVARADVVRNRMPRGFLHLEKLLTRKKRVTGEMHEKVSGKSKRALPSIETCRG